MTWSIKSLYWNIQRVIRWIPIIWKDREFDHTYFLQILSFKLKLMEEFYRSKYAWSVDSKDVAMKIHICKLLCDRLIEDDYNDMLGRKIKMFSSPAAKYGYSRLEFEVLDEGCQLGICKDWIHYETYMQKQDLNLLCKIIQKHLFCWWD